MSKINHKKLLNTKWTAINPQNKEKHFIVTKVEVSENDPQKIISITMTACMTNKNYQKDYQELNDTNKWKQGWV